MPISDEFRSLLERAAELRTTGQTWKAVAEALNRTVVTVRRWPEQYPVEWAEVSRAADENLVAEAGYESVHSLRKLLRSEDEKIVRDAAVAVLKWRSEQLPSRPTSPVDPTSTYLSSLTHEERETLLRELLADARSTLAPPAARLEVEPGAGQPE